MKYRYSYTNYYSHKPKYWKCVKPLIYSNEVNVVNQEDQSVGKLVIEYKICEGRKIDEEWLKESLNKRFGKNIKYFIHNFERDGSSMSFIKTIFMTKEEFIRIKREEKLKRILEE